VQETEPEITSTPYSFSVVSDNRCLVLSAASAEEKDKWMEDISMAGTAAGPQPRDATDTGAKISYPSLKSNSAYCAPCCKFQLFYQCRVLTAVLMWLLLCEVGFFKISVYKLGTCKA